MRVEYIEEKYAETKAGLPGVKKLDSMTIMKECQDLSDVVF